MTDFQKLNPTARVKLNPTYYANDAIETAAIEIDQIEKGLETLSFAEILEKIAKTESEIGEALHFLEIAKVRYSARKKKAKGRVIHRDVVQRYIKIYGGSTFKQFNGYDDFRVFLKDIDDEVRGEVTQFNRFSEKPPDLSDMPF